MGKSVLTIHICIKFLPRVKGITGYDDMYDVMSRKGENIHTREEFIESWEKIFIHTTLQNTYFIQEKERVVKKNIWFECKEKMKQKCESY